MPLLSQLNHSDNIAIWKIEESESQLKELLKEHSWIDDALLEISHPEKRIEYLASRVLVKILCQRFMLQFDGIFKDEHHKPYLVGQQGHISISHSTSYCAVIFDQQKSVGIDIQIVEDKLKFVAKKFLSSSEIALYTNDIVTLCKTWCAKEAIYKMVGKKGVSLRTQIKILKFNNQYAELEAHFENQKHHSMINFLEFDNFVLGYTKN